MQYSKLNYDNQKASCYTDAHFVSRSFTQSYLCARGEEHITFHDAIAIAPCRGSTVSYMLCTIHALSTHATPLERATRASDKYDEISVT